LVVVQGIVDGYFKEGDELILLDYKTDHVKPGQENILAKRYETQLRYYRETLEQLTGLKVAETYLYSFALDKEIRVL
jgi:ATP-dependent helicase/nuclease subunit A